MDTDTPWRYFAGKWQGIPLGVIAVASGNPVVERTGAYGSWWSMTFNAKAERRYLIHVRATFGQVTANGNGWIEIRDWQSPEEYRLTVLQNLVTFAGSQNQYAIASTIFYNASTSKEKWVQLSGNVSAGALRLNAGSGWISVEDVGSF